MERKIIQISTWGRANEERQECGFYALCNDGTVWLNAFNWKRKDWDWYQMDPIPQPKKTKEVDMKSYLNEKV